MSSPATWMESIVDNDRVISWIKANTSNIMLFLVFVFLAYRQAKSKVETAKKAGAETRHLLAPDFPEISSLPEDFDWKREEPVKLRPFKPKYHLTMDFDESALQNLEPSELLVMDRTYADRLQYRDRILKENKDIAVAVNDEKRIGGAVRELYTFLLGTYLPKRYPNMFKLHLTDFETGRAFMLENLVSGRIFPVRPSARVTTETILETLGRTVDEDFLFLVPEEESEDPKYVLEAFVTICPSGFNPREKLGKRLADIHQPVPSYADKIGGSMDRFFKTVEVGKYVKRANWTITTHGDLFTPGNSTNHAEEGETVEEMEAIDVESTYVRCERQTLHRLPESKALVFAFRTYLYPIKDIKEEGLGEELAEAIDGMQKGNAPGIYFYKRGVVWGNAVKRYLRSSD